MRDRRSRPSGAPTAPAAASTTAATGFAITATAPTAAPRLTGIDVLIAPPQAALDHMNDFVRDMHTSSGLLDDLAKGLVLEEATDRVSLCCPG